MEETARHCNDSSLLLLLLLLLPDPGEVLATSLASGALAPPFLASAKRFPGRESVQEMQ